MARPEEHRLQRGTTEVIRNDHRREGISLTGMQPRGAEKRDKKKRVEKWHSEVETGNQELQKGC